MPGGGNHRGSIFRLHVGKALLAREKWPQTIRESWGVGSNASSAVRQREYLLECAVSRHIGAMSFLWLGVDDPPSTASDRGVIEAGAIALLSNIGQTAGDQPSTGWLGHNAGPTISSSGLWNVNHVRDTYDPSFLDVLEHHTRRA